MSKDGNLTQMAKAAGDESLEEDAIMSQLIAWAHEASDESRCKLQEFIDDEKQSDEMRRMAEIAQGEAEFMRYQPTNENEEQEYNLCELINKHENRLDDLFLKQEETMHWLMQMELDKKIHEQVMLQPMADDAQKHNWDTNVSETAMAMEQNDLDKLQLEIGYEEAWLEEAKKLITSKKYQNLPPGYFDKEIDEMDDDECECDHCQYCDKGK